MDSELHSLPSPSLGLDWAAIEANLARARARISRPTGAQRRQARAEEQGASLRERLGLRVRPGAEPASERSEREAARREAERAEHFRRARREGLGVAQAGRRLGIGPMAVYRLVALGELPATLVGRNQLRILPADIEAYLAEQGHGSA